MLDIPSRTFGGAGGESRGPLIESEVLPPGNPLAGQLLSLGQGGDVSLSDPLTGRVRFEARLPGVSTVTAVGRTELVGGRNAAVASEGSLLRINMETGETVAVPSSAVFTYDVLYEPSSGALYSIGVDASRHHQPSPALGPRLRDGDDDRQGGLGGSFCGAGLRSFHGPSVLVAGFGADRGLGRGLPCPDEVPRHGTDPPHPAGPRRAAVRPGQGFDRRDLGREGRGPCRDLRVPRWGVVLPFFGREVRVVPGRARAGQRHCRRAARRRIPRPAGSSSPTRPPGRPLSRARGSPGSSRSPRGLPG